MSEETKNMLLPDSIFNTNSLEYELDCSEDEERGRLIVDAFSRLDIKSEIMKIHHGPTFTLYELSFDGRKKISSILGFADNLAMVLEVEDVRLLAPIPGKNAIGVEVPNKKRSTVRFGSMINAVASEDGKKLPVALGKDVDWNPVVIDLTRCPHLLIGGKEGAGKTVFLDSLICSILCTKTAEEVRFILVDTKMVELSVYNGIPHLLTPVITDEGKALKALYYVVEEMERRIGLFTETGARKIEEYNSKAEVKLPYIVVVIDDLEDLMHSSGKEVEYLIKRITAIARFCGIHLVLSTRRVSVDVITGVVKSNIPTQIAFAVSNALNSRILIDQPGAEKLLGLGDMLYTSHESRNPSRIQGAFVDDSEIGKIVDFLKTQGEPDYLDESYFEDTEDEK